MQASFVSEDLKRRENDVIWRVRCKEEWLYIYLLIEFQSQPDPWMALRMLVYVSLLYQRLERTRELTTHGLLPPVFETRSHGPPWECIPEPACSSTARGARSSNPPQPP